jgi:hypothetical protein
VAKGGGNQHEPGGAGNKRSNPPKAGGPRLTPQILEPSPRLQPLARTVGRFLENLTAMLSTCTDPPGAYRPAIVGGEFSCNADTAATTDCRAHLRQLIPLGDVSAVINRPSTGAKKLWTAPWPVF